MRRRLGSDGLYVLNIVDRYPDPLLVKAMYNTLSSVFDQVRVWLPQQNAPLPRAAYVIEAGTDLHGDTGTPLSQLPLLTDDFVPLDRLVRSAVLAPSR